jgi:outer membrane receptor for ferric coprogen and ferric-rhodotorulic acid
MARRGPSTAPTASPALSSPKARPTTVRAALEDRAFVAWFGEANSHGVELDLAGTILPHWNLLIAYAYTEAKIVSDVAALRPFERAVGDPRLLGEYGAAEVLPDPRKRWGRWR